jgi:hypothetical protein
MSLSISFLRKLAAGVALVSLISVSQNPSVAFAQIARTFSYQGELLDGTAPATGFHNITASYYNASGTLLYTETFTNVSVSKGIFSVMLGSANPGFPQSMTFTEQYFLGVAIDGKAELAPRTLLTGVPYSINANAIDGIEASLVPTAGKLLPLDSTGHFDRRVIPATAGGFSSINNVFPDNGSNITLQAGANVQISNDQTNHKITVASSGISGVIAGTGLQGGGTSGTVMLSIDATAIANNAIGGRKIDPLMAGLGIYQDALGNLNVGVDNSTIDIINDVVRVRPGGITTLQLADGSVTTSKIVNGAVNGSKIDPTQVQVRVLGAAGPGSFVQSINQDGTVNTGSVLVDPTLFRTSTGTDVTLGIALNHSNQWTGLQSFAGGATASTLAVFGATTLNGTTNNGLFTNNGNVQTNGALGVTGFSTLSGLTNNGNATINGNTIITGSSDLRGPITNTTGPINLVGNATLTGTFTAPSSGHVLGTTGLDATVLTINGVPGGPNTELRVNGDGNLTGSLGIQGTTTTQVLNSTTINATTVNTSNIGGAGGLGTLTLTSPLNAGLGSFSQPITGGTFVGYTLNSGSISSSATLTNGGTITGGNLTNATITGGSMNNTPIGATSPNTAAFTSLNATGNSTIGTGANTANSIGNGNNSNNSFGQGTGSNNFFGTGAGSTNIYGSINGTNTFNGLINVGSSTANGPKLIVNGVVSPAWPVAADWEFIVNGDVQATGTLVSPIGGFNTISSDNQTLNDINVVRGLNLNGAPNQNNLRVGGTTTMQGLLTANGGILNNGTLTQNGVATFNALSTFSGITDNGPLVQNGISTFNAAVTNASTLLQQGASTFNGAVTNNSTLLQQGTSTFNGAVTNNSTLSQVGTSSFTGLSTFHGITDLGVLTQTGNSAFTGTNTMTSGSNTTTLAINNTNSSSSTTFAHTVSTGGLYGMSIQCKGQTGTGLNHNTHFLDFFDASSSNARGSIQGQDGTDFISDPINATLLATNTAIIAAGVASVAAAALVTDTPAALAAALADAALVAQYVAITLIQTTTNLGIAYTSSSGDYAEYLLRADPTEKLFAGDIVGMNNGVISKNTVGAQSILSISLAPIVLGNTPPAGQEKAYNKVAFLGQVPVKVRGIVHEGDFIIASGLNDGIGVAVNAADITPQQFAQVLGRSWTASDMAQIKYVKVAVGLNAKSTSEILSREEAEINQLKQQVGELKKTNAEVATMKTKLDRIEQALSNGTIQTVREVKLTKN